MIAFCQQQGVGRLFIGNPDGVRKRNQRTPSQPAHGRWEYGQDIAYLTYKAEAASIESFTGSERGTSSQCPVCGWKQKVQGRVNGAAAIPSVPLQGHRDVVGSVNMHPLAFGSEDRLPRSHHVSTSRPRKGPGAG